VIFQRLHSRSSYEGTGIGLAMCRKIIEYHGGRMWLDTGYRSGSAFCFTLRARPEDL
jgi:light-regulated signal transduction histidine kinase (bacteriophytochrome)